MSPSRLIAATIGLASCVIPVNIGDGIEVSGTSAGLADRDGDGFSFKQGDCDDFDSQVGPGFPEECDGLDNDCDGTIDIRYPADVHACARTDVFVQRLLLDVLFVVDASAAMAPHHDRIIEGAEAFLPELVGPDLETHLGVLTMDMHNPQHQGRLVRVMGANGVELWLDGSQTTLDGATQWVTRAIDELDVLLWGEEGGRAVVEAALFQHADGDNAGFLRAEARLAVIFISNEEDPTLQPLRKDFLDSLTALKTSLAEVQLHTITQLTDFNCAGVLSPSTRGLSYDLMASATQGHTQDICAPTYTQFMTTIGQDSADFSLQSQQFDLSRPAQGASSMSVRLEFPGGTEQPLVDEFSLKPGNVNLVIDLVPPPPAGTIITVDYLQAIDGETPPDPQ